MIGEKLVSNEIVNKNWHDFGSKMHVIAILTILTFVLPFAGIIQLIFIFLALADIRKIMYQSPDADLSEFRTKYIAGFLVKLIGFILIYSAIVSMIPFAYFHFYFPIIGFAMAIVFGGVILLVSAIIEYKAWSCLETFFENYQSNFPDAIARDTLKGIKNIKTAVIFRITIVLSFVSVILEIIGYFRIGSLKNLPIQRAQVVPQQPIQRPPAQPQYEPAPVAPIKQKTPSEFCPHCGAKSSSSGVYCSECGASLS